MTEAHGGALPEDPTEYLYRAFAANPAVLADFRLLAEHAPGAVAGYGTMRASLLERDGSPLLDPAARELVLLAIEVATRKSNPPPIGPALRALELGASLRDVAEVIAMCMMVCGMVTFQDSGRYVLRAATEADAARRVPGV